MPHKSPAKRAEQSERLSWFNQQITDGKYPTATRLAEHFNISISTAQKDIEALKKVHRAPLAYDRKHHGFRYTNPLFTLEPGKPLPEAKPAAEHERAQPAESDLKQGELVAILVADALRKQYRTAPFNDSIRDAFNKIAASLGESASYDRESLDRIIELDLEPFPTLDLGIFDALLKAIAWHETVVLKYFSGQKATVTSKPCDPLHVINYKDNWYLVAFCHEKQDYRDFLANRILSIEFTGTNFQPYTSFNIERHKRDSQLFKGMESPVEVVMEFDKFAAHWIRVRPVHKTQKIVERADGSLEISFKVYSYENLLRWVLSFGEHARVLAPLELQERVHKTISRMNYLYNRF